MIIRPLAHVAEVDLERPDAVRDAVRRERPDVVVNAAAYTAVDRAEEEPDRARRVNADAVGVMADAPVDAAQSADAPHEPPQESGTRKPSLSKHLERVSERLSRLLGRHDLPEPFLERVNQTISAVAEARDRADAAYLASELQARMWGDLRNLAEYNGCPTTYATCQEWRNKLAAVLPGSAGQTQSVTVSGNLVSIVLRWKTANGETRNYSAQTTIVAAQ